MSEQIEWDTADELYAYYDAAYRMGASEAYNNDAGYRRAQEDMFIERDKLAARIDQLTAQLADANKSLQAIADFQGLMFGDSEATNE